MNPHRGLLALISILAMAGLAHAQPFPAMPVRLVAGFFLRLGRRCHRAHLRAEALRVLGADGDGRKSIGANGMVGTESVARAAKDGYTLFLSTPSEVALNPLLYSKTPTSRCVTARRSRSW